MARPATVISFMMMLFWRASQYFDSSISVYSYKINPHKYNPTAKKSILFQLFTKYFKIPKLRSFKKNSERYIIIKILSHLSGSSVSLSNVLLDTKTVLIKTRIKMREFQICDVRILSTNKQEFKHYLILPKKSHFLIYFFEKNILSRWSSSKIEKNAKISINSLVSLENIDIDIIY